MMGNGKRDCESVVFENLKVDEISLKEEKAKLNQLGTRIYSHCE
jgi:hypothetical protein